MIISGFYDYMYICLQFSSAEIFGELNQAVSPLGYDQVDRDSYSFTTLEECQERCRKRTDFRCE